jgi:hypothetical protein
MAPIDCGSLLFHAYPKVTPASRLTQTPPVAAAIHSVSGCVTSVTMSVTRAPTFVGPNERHRFFSSFGATSLVRARIRVA